MMFIDPPGILDGLLDEDGVKWRLVDAKDKGATLAITSRSRTEIISL